jgi:hypothetical protein
VAPVVPCGNGDHLIKPAVTQCCGGTTDESAGLPAGCTVAVETVADDDNRINQHEREQDDIGTPDQVHRAPQISNAPPAPICLPRVETGIEHQGNSTPLLLNPYIRNRHRIERLGSLTQLIPGSSA